MAEVARRLDRYPNFAVDTSARLHSLARQNTETVRQFFLDYQDRVLFGTDMSSQWRLLSSVSETVRQQHLQSLESRYHTAFAYYETEQKVMIRGREVRGLGLPQAVLVKFYYGNACKWYPGL